MVGDRVSADDEAAGVDTCASYRSFEHLRIFDGIGQMLVGRSLGILQFLHIFDGIGQVHLRALPIRTVWQTVRDSLAEFVGQSQGHLLHTGHILDGVLRGHCGVGDDMGTVLVAVFILHPFQHLTTSVIVEVGIDIGE